MPWRLVAIEATAAVVLAAAAQAGTLHLAARLTANIEGSAVNSSTPAGNLWADLDTRDRLLTYRLTYRGLSGPATNVRLQGPVKPGQAGAATVTLTDTASPVTGEATLTAAEAADLERGRWHVDIATTANPDGEIRGQVMLQAEQGQSPPLEGAPASPSKSTSGSSPQLGWSPQLSW